MQDVLGMNEFPGERIDVLSKTSLIDRTRLLLFQNCFTPASFDNSHRFRRPVPVLNEMSFPLKARLTHAKSAPQLWQPNQDNSRFNSRRIADRLQTLGYKVSRSSKYTKHHHRPTALAPHTDANFSLRTKVYSQWSLNSSSNPSPRICLTAVGTSSFGATPPGALSFVKYRS
jgi:hypothetical protein